MNDELKNTTKELFPVCVASTFSEVHDFVKNNIGVELTDDQIREVGYGNDEEFMHTYFSTILGIAAEITNTKDKIKYYDGNL